MNLYAGSFETNYSLEIQFYIGLKLHNRHKIFLPWYPRPKYPNQKENYPVYSSFYFLSFKFHAKVLKWKWFSITIYHPIIIVADTNIWKLGSVQVTFSSHIFHLQLKLPKSTTLLQLRRIWMVGSSENFFVAIWDDELVKILTWGTSFFFFFFVKPFIQQVIDSFQVKQFVTHSLDLWGKRFL